MLVDLNDGKPNDVNKVYVPLCFDFVSPPI